MENKIESGIERQLKELVEIAELRERMQGALFFRENTVRNFRLRGKAQTVSTLLKEALKKEQSFNLYLQSEDDAKHL